MRKHHYAEHQPEKECVSAVTRFEDRKKCFHIRV
jgi:hypothetical protein